MSFERSAFLSMMPSTVNLAPRTGHNNYGEPTWGPNVPFRARVVNKPSQRRDNEGEVVEVRTVVWLASTGIIIATDRITLPDGTTPQIVGVDRYPDQSGTHHHKIYCGH